MVNWIKSLFNLNDFGFGDAVIVDCDGHERPLELDLDQAVNSDNVWEWAKRCLNPGEVIFFGYHQAGTA